MTDFERLVEVGIKNWELQASRFTQILASIPEDQFAVPLAPGRNRPLYVAGHLIAVTDSMIPTLGLGERLHPELEELFIKNPDDPAKTYPSPAEIKSLWGVVSGTLAERQRALPAAEWLAKHSLVSTEDFEKDPTRNRFAILLNRMSHLGYHLGQLRFAKP